MSHKKLTRSAANRVLAGICGGLGNYFDIDPIVFRVIFIVLGIGGGGIIAYIIMMFVIPSEKDVAPAYPSKGINEEWINEVGNEIKEEVKANVKNDTQILSIIIGLGLICLGFFCLFPWFHFRFFFPVALIIFGLSILLLQINKSKKNHYEK
jgi:phage shock protein C